MAKLYKFKSCDNIVQLCEMIKGQRFFCANWKKFNDPMEGAYNANKFTIGEKENLEQFAKELFTYKENFRILSLSLAIDDIYMWAHYANGFTGVAIEVDVPDQEFNDATNGIYTESSELFKVRYVAKIEDLDKFTGNSVGMKAKKIISNKLDVWNREIEYRYIANDDYRILPITKVIFGMRTSDIVKEIIRRIANNILVSDSGIDRVTNKIVHY